MKQRRHRCIGINARILARRPRTALKAASRGAAHLLLVCAAMRGGTNVWRHSRSDAAVLSTLIGGCTRGGLRTSLRACNSAAARAPL